MSMRDNTEGKQRPILPVLLAVGAVLTLLLVAGLLLERASDQPGPTVSGGKTVEEMLGLTDDGVEAPIYYDGVWYVRNPDVEAYLFMGIDRSGEAAPVGSYIGGGQADVLLLLILDHQNERYSLLQINRDTMTKVEILGVLGDVVGSETQQIALAHGYGDGMEDSCENTVRAVSNLLYGMEIDGYAAIQMDAIPVLNDMIGGVAVTIEDDFSQIDLSLVQGETIRLMGQQALTFVRTRHYVDDNSNLSRMRRQRAYLSAFAEQFQGRAAAEPELVLTMYDAVQDYMVTDLSGGDVSRIAEWCHEYENQGILTIDGEAEMGEEYIEYYADEDSLQATVLELFYLETDDETSGG